MPTKSIKKVSMVYITNHLTLKYVIKTPFRKIQALLIQLKAGIHY